MNVKPKSASDARTILIGLVGEYGQEIASQPRRLEGLLRDFCPACRPEIAALTAALKVPVIQDLLNPRNPIPVSLLVAQLARRLQDRLGLAESLAYWAVESWAIALGIVEESTGPGISPEPITEIETTDTSSVADTIIPLAPAKLNVPTPQSQTASDADRQRQIVDQADKALQEAKRAVAVKESLSFAEEALQLATTASRLFSNPPAAEAIAVQAKALLVRAAWQCACESQITGYLTKSREYLGRVLEMQPNHADAQALQAEIERTRQELLKQAETYWSACKLPKAISRLEKGLVAFPGDQEIGERLDRWKKISVRVEHVLRQELPQLKAKSQFYTMLQMLRSLEAMGAPVQGLDQYRAQVEKKVELASPALNKAHGALDRHDFAAVIRQCERALAIIPDHGDALEIRDLARTGLDENQCRAVAIQIAVESGHWAQAAMQLAEISEADRRQPPFAEWHRQLEQMKTRMQFCWRFMGAAFGGGVLWILAGFLARKASPALRAPNKTGILTTCLQAMLAQYLVGNNRGSAESSSYRKSDRDSGYDSFECGRIRLERSRYAQAIGLG